jgi:aromatic ring hydroxylase
VTEPEVQRTLPRIVSIDGAPCHPFWSFPATKEDLLDNILVARQVSRVSPAAGYATIGRDELAALYVVSSALKREGKGEYFERVREYVRRFQREKPYFDKYYAGATGTAEERMRLFRFIRDLTASEYAGWWDVKIIHGSGSPAAEWLQMYREYDLGRAAKHVDALVTGR